MLGRKVEGFMTVSSSVLQDQSFSGNSNVDLVLVDQALTSLRSSGHDAPSAIGETIDNSLQAGANHIHIRLFTEKRTIGNSKRSVQVVERVAIGDDGSGMDFDTLWRYPQLGFSTRYNDRTG